MRIYVSGVGGVAMSPIAYIARDLGYDVVCSDSSDHGNLVEHMRENGFKVHVPQDGSGIQEEHESQPIDWFVYTAALPDDHPELRYAREVGMKTTKRDGFINELLASQNLKMVAIAGTHGKTNTTSMVAWCLQKAGIPISYSIGTRIPFGPIGKHEPRSQYFIYEADEFDRNFLQYHPAISIVLNIDYDHPDCFPDQADYDMAFAQFIQQSDKVYLYDDAIDIEAPNVHTVTKNPDEASTTIPGKYIRQNARLVQEMLLHEFDVPMIDSADYINDYPGSSRRMEQLVDGLYTDYAHHPDEIRSALEIGMEIAEDVVVVYQPHQNVRQHEILDAYTDCFEGASKVYWLPTYLSREDADLDILKPEELMDGLTNASIAEVADLNDELVDKINADIAAGSTVIGMAAGDLDAWLRENFIDSDESEL